MRQILYAFLLIPCFLSGREEAPEWVKTGVVYAVYPRNFSEPGNLKEVTTKLEHIHDLGVNILWLLPIHPIGELKRKGTLGSPYSVKNYSEINPDYGTYDDLKLLVEKAHQLGIKVIMDVVANHTSWDNPLLLQPDFYLQDSFGSIVSPLPEWHDVAALNYNNHEVRRYMVDLWSWWLKEFDLDGFRLDCSSMMPIDFWEDFGKDMRAIKKEIVLIGEEDRPQSLENAFDVDYSWHFEEALEGIILHGLHATNTLKKILNDEIEAYPKQSLHLRFSDNHDKKRSITRYGAKAAMAAAAMTFIVNGVPLIYNGMEIGDTTESTDPALFEKQPIMWVNGQIRPEFNSFYRKLIALRQDFIDSPLTWVSNRTEESVVTLRRGSFFIAINFSNKQVENLQPWEVKIERIKDEIY